MLVKDLVKVSDCRIQLFNADTCSSITDDEFDIGYAEINKTYSTDDELDLFDKKYGNLEIQFIDLDYQAFAVYVIIK